MDLSTALLAASLVSLSFEDSAAALIVRSRHRPALKIDVKWVSLSLSSPQQVVRRVLTA